MVDLHSSSRLLSDTKTEPVDPCKWLKIDREDLLRLPCLKFLAVWLSRCKRSSLSIFFWLRCPAKNRLDSVSRTSCRVYLYRSSFSLFKSNLQTLFSCLMSNVHFIPITTCSGPFRLSRSFFSVPVRKLCVTVNSLYFFLIRSFSSSSCLFTLSWVQTSRSSSSRGFSTL